MEIYDVRGVTAQSLALHTQAVLQGAFILAKADGGPQAAIDSVAHLRRYFDLLFNETGGARQPGSERDVG
jgi:TetR/AcrR family transcriptional repressor of nem operon